MDHADTMTLKTMKGRSTGTNGRARRGSSSSSAITAVLLMAFAAFGCADAEQRQTAGTTASSGIAPPKLDPSAPPPASPAGALPTRAEVEALGYTFGDPAAPIHVIEMSDFGCGYCRKFHEESFPILMDEYVDAGSVFWRFIPFDVGMFPNAEGALNAGECAGEQGQIREAGDLLFSRQGEWKQSGDVSDELRAIVTAGGVDVSAWQECIDSGRREERGAANSTMARRLGVRGTPTFFIDGYPIQGALPLDTFKQLFESVLNERDAAPTE